jgi:hypothetical protein
MKSFPKDRINAYENIHAWVGRLVSKHQDNPGNA